MVLLNEFDFDSDHTAAKLFQRNYLSVGRPGHRPIEFKHRFLAEVNTGVPSGQSTRALSRITPSS